MRVRFSVWALLFPLVACGDDPVAPAAGDAGRTGGSAGTTSAAGTGGAGASAVGGAAGTLAGGANAGGTASGGGGTGNTAGSPAAGGAPAASGPVHGALRDLGGGKIGLRLGDFPFACAENPETAVCGPTPRALVTADFAANALVAGSAPIALVGEAHASAAAPGCAANEASFTGSLSVLEVSDTSAKVKLQGSSAAGFDGELSLRRCTAAVAPGTAIATHTATGIVVEAGNYSITCASAPTPAPCGGRYRLDFALTNAQLVAGKYPAGGTPAPTYATTSPEPSGCSTQTGALTGQIEIIEVLPDRVRLRPLATNVLAANKSVFDALFCD